MTDLKSIQKKWIKKWQDNKVFQSEPDKSKKKFFGTFPYPYVNSYLHLGHFYSSMRLEALSRYKRMKGFNVLYAQGWHATGSPIVNAAKRVADKEPKQWDILKMQGFSDEEIRKFEDPKAWVDYFPKEAEKDFTNMGYSIDWRRQFYTTDLNPHYDKFIRWQFNTLKKDNKVIQGKFPVVWCPKENNPVGDHSRLEGEGETPKDFLWIKYRMKDSDLIMMAGTTRPDAVLATTHIWIDPNGKYVVVKVKDEKWVVGKKAVQKIIDQYADAEIIKEIDPKELIGKWCHTPIRDYDVYTVPAWFIDADVGSGIVYSALEDPVDLVEIQHIQRDLSMLKDRNLDLEVVKKLKPISIIHIEGMSDNLGQDMIDKYKITSPKESQKVKDAKDDLNKAVFRKGVMKSNCLKYSGMTVPKCQEEIKNDLLQNNDAAMFYELTDKVVCRCLTPSIVKVVDDQWFLAYGDEEWKKKAHKCLDKMKLYPEKTRQQFDYVLDWLRNWACTREVGLGTRLPWDEKWLIESLSDSTIYMAYYTINYKLQKIDPTKLDDAFFDYVLLGKGDINNLKVDKKIADELREEFEYWYPMDFRTTGKDLIQNHMSFSIFNHTAIFPKKNWPKSFGLNGHVMVDGEKMSKSKGNFIIMRQALEDYGADSARFTALSGGEGIDDANFDREMAKIMNIKLYQILDLVDQYYNKGVDEERTIDSWMNSQINSIIKESTEYMEETLMRSVLQRVYFDLQRAIKWYLRRTNNKPNKKIMNKAIETQILLLAPFTPFVCEEAWKKMGKEGFISLAQWPKYEESQVDKKSEALEDFIRSTMEDITAVMKLAKVDKPKVVKIFISPKWKYDFYSKLKSKLEKTRDMKEILGSFSSDDKFKYHMKDISGIVQRHIKSGKIPDDVLTQDLELKSINESKDFIEKEFKCSIEIYIAEKLDENKAKQARPEKVAILVE